MRQLSYQKLFHTAVHALEAGADHLKPMRVEWDFSGKCDRPFVRELFARDTVSLGDGWATARAVLMLVIKTPCRVCGACMKARATLWRLRALAEVVQSRRTWFGTLTISPESGYYYLSLARDRAAKSACPDFDTMSDDEKFRRVVDAVYPAISLWLKRVRKQSKARLRYLLVTEAHRSGVPHFHLLVHERSGRVGERILRKQWTAGFSMFTLCRDNQRSAVYICKYLMKSARARVRASQRYGRFVLKENETTVLPKAIANDSKREFSDPPIDNYFVGKVTDHARDLSSSENQHSRFEEINTDQDCVVL